MESPQLPPESKRQTRRLVIGATAFALGLWMTQIPKYLVDTDGPAWIRAGLLLLSWAALGGLVFVARRFPYEDELEIFINRRALGFAFYTAFLGSIALYHLESARFIPAIEWTGKGVMTVLAILLLLGLGLSKLRYR